MEIRIVVEDVTRVEADALVVNLFEGTTQPGGATGAVDRALDGVISSLIGQGEVKGKLGELTMIHTFGKIPSERVVVCGLGKQGEFDVDRVRRVTAEACRYVRSRGAKIVATITHGTGAGGIGPRESARAIAEGAVLGLYVFRRHITKEPETGEVEELIIVERDEDRLPELRRGSALGKVEAEAAKVARDMVNEPANVMTPTRMAEVARAMSADYNLECSVLGRDEMNEMGMGALLGVAGGSHEEPRLIVLSYRGDPSSDQALGLVGKGITFDSGGISIKPAAGMEEMKGDMAGGAAVIAAMQAVAELKPKINVTAVVPATENLPGGGAQRPGDVVTAMNGKTIEVVNTDAEGRLILAEALCYARHLKLSPIVDIATLTGACHIALGNVCSGAFTNNQDLLDKVLKAGGSVGERLWQLPMYEEYKEQNKSEVADIKNSGGRYGGAITAAQFLAAFVEDTPWVHLDIAGTSDSDKEKGYVVKGATGVGVRTMVDLVLTLAEG